MGGKYFDCPQTKKIHKLQKLVKNYRHLKVVQTALLQISELASSVTDLSKLYIELHQVLKKLLHADNFYIALYDPDRYRLSIRYMEDEYDSFTAQELDAIELNNSITEFIYKNNRPLLCAKNEYKAMAEQGLFINRGALCEQWMGVPLHRDSVVIGVVAIQTYDENRIYSLQELRLFTHLSLHLSNAIARVSRREWLEREILKRTSQLQQSYDELADRIQEAEQSRQVQQALFEISELTASGMDMYSFYQSLHHILKTLIVADNFYIALMTDSKNALTFPYYVDQYTSKGEKRSLGLGFTEYVIRTKEAQLIDEERAKQLIHQGEIVRQTKYRKQHTTSWLGAPLFSDNEVIGVITIQSYTVHRYTQDDLKLLTYVSHHIAVAIARLLSQKALRESYDLLEDKVRKRTFDLRKANQSLLNEIEQRKEVEEKLYFEANHDPLTGLPNRACLIQRIESAMRYYANETELSFALLFIDLDRFKCINDQLGHQAGDVFLIQAAKRISHCIRGKDIVARFGGDEFVLLLNDIAHISQAEEIAQRIIDQVSKPFFIDNEQAHSGASIGIACYQTQHTSYDDVMRDADEAMYQAKRQGRSRYVIFDQNNTHQARSKSLKTKFRERIAELKTSNILDPTIRQVFGKMIENTWDEHIEPADLAMIQRHHLDMKFDKLLLSKIRGEWIAQSDALYFVTVSVKHLIQEKSLYRLCKQLRRFPKHRLCLCFNEPELMGIDVKILTKAMHRFHSNGVFCAISDFGHSGGNLLYALQSPIDFVLIDPKLAIDKVYALTNALFAISGQFHFSVVTHPEIADSAPSDHDWLYYQQKIPPTDKTNFELDPLGVEQSQPEETV
ncbi:diguanylate cyclase domain-containing protein [Algicola sagamiensis]|uniref:diguanylate cyclase domain-containing protein n=1 Tax=Algicola sagamiensis TaxID=163869 RepID=UPI00037D77B3|nr:diguanylate cyclase [Algicola sagamiensis]